MQCVILWFVKVPESVTSVLAWHATILGLNEEIHGDTQEEILFRNLPASQRVHTVLPEFTVMASAAQVRHFSEPGCAA